MTIQPTTQLVLDTNVLLVSIPSRSPYHAIFQAFLAERFTLCVTTDILIKYSEIFSQRANSLVATNALEAIESAVNVNWITRYYPWGLITVDPDDNKFVDCAIAANALFIVTNDHHFNVLSTIPFPSVNTIDIDRFLAILAGDVPPIS